MAKKLKKIVVVMMLTLMLVDMLLLAPSIKAENYTTILSQDFDDEPTGSVPQGWTVENPQICSLKVNEAVYYGSSGKSARYVDSVQGDYSLVGRNFAHQTGSLILEFSMRMDVPDPEWPSPLTFYIDDGTRIPKDPNQKGANVYFGIDGEGNRNNAISYFDGAAHYLRPMSYDTWYRIKMVINITANTYDIYIDGSVEAEGVHFLQWGGTVTQLSRIQFGCSGGKFSGYIDDITIRIAYETYEQIWLQWWFWAIIVLGIIASVLAFTTLRYRKKAVISKESKVTSTKPISQEYKVCPNCGANLPADSKFCGKCGTSLS